MGKTLLDGLRAHTAIAVDTGDIDVIARYTPRDATTNPTLIAAAAKLPAYAALVDRALEDARREAAPGARAEVIAAGAIDRLFVAFGRRILAVVPGRVSTEVDARLSFDTPATIQRARAIVALYERARVPRERLLIKIASTWEGIRAAEALEREGIHCNMTLLFGLHQAIACGDAGATLVSPFVGRILDYHLEAEGRASYPAAEDPGVLSVKRIYEYLKRFAYPTEIMGASFRNVGEIVELAGCDFLTISPKLLAELASTEGEVPRRLDAALAVATELERVVMDEAAFRRAHEVDPVARTKLAEGIEGFARDAATIEHMLVERLASP